MHVQVDRFIPNVVLHLTMTDKTIISLDLIEFEVPNGCNCERVDDNYAIVTSDSMPDLHICIRPYNMSRAGNYYSRGIGTLSGIIDGIIGVDPVREKRRYRSFGEKIGENYWCKHEWHLVWDSQQIEIDAWLNKLGEDFMCLAIARFPDGKPDPSIREILGSIKSK